MKKILLYAGIMLCLLSTGQDYSAQSVSESFPLFVTREGQDIVTGRVAEGEFKPIDRISVSIGLPKITLGKNVEGRSILLTSTSKNSIQPYEINTTGYITSLGLPIKTEFNVENMAIAPVNGRTILLVGTRKPGGPLRSSDFIESFEMNNDGSTTALEKPLAIDSSISSIAMGDVQNKTFAFIAPHYRITPANPIKLYEVYNDGSLNFVRNATEITNKEIQANGMVLKTIDQTPLLFIASPPRCGAEMLGERCFSPETFTEFAVQAYRVHSDGTLGDFERRQVIVNSARAPMIAVDPQNNILSVTSTDHVGSDDTTTTFYEIRKGTFVPLWGDDLNLKGSWLFMVP